MTAAETGHHSKTFQLAFSACWPFVFWLGLILLVDISVVIATRNRASRLETTLERLVALPERPSILVVDNGSDDDTVERASPFHGVAVVSLTRNLGAAARNIGTRLCESEFIAFADDDSWWEPGALELAEAILAADGTVALVAAQVRVADGCAGSPAFHLDPVSFAMSRGSTLHRGRPIVTGFLACAAVVRRSAFLAAGGFEAGFLIGGEEELLALNLAASGWKLVYEPRSLVTHQPEGAPRPGRRRLELANSLLTGWTRLPTGAALTRMSRATRQVLREPSLAPALSALVRAPWVSGGRRPVPGDVAAAHVDNEASYSKMALALDEVATASSTP